MSCAGRAALLALAPLPAVLVAVRLLGWWPCSEGCGGGGFYQRLAGLPVLWPALVAYLLLIPVAALAPIAPRLLGAYAWLLAGVSLFFLAMAWALGLECRFCIAVHGAVLVLAVAARPWPGRVGIAALLIGGLGANAAFHHGPVPDLVPPAVPAVPAAPAAEDLAARADANRGRGSPVAVALVEAVLDLQCPHCAARWRDIAAAVAPAVQAGRVRLVVRLAARTGNPAGRDLARWAFAAALDSPVAHGRLITDLLGTRADLTAEQLLIAHPEALAVPEAVARIHRAMLDRLVDADQARIRALGTAATPLLVLTRAGTEVARWREGADLAAFAADL